MIHQGRHSALARLGVVVVSLVIVSLSQPVHAINWNNSAGGTFNDHLNWQGGVVPGPADNANFNLSAAGYTVNFSANATNLRMTVPNDTVTFNMSAVYTLTDTSQFSLAVGSALGGNGQLTTILGTIFTNTTVVGQATGSHGTLNISNQTNFFATGLCLAGQIGSGTILVGPGAELETGTGQLGSEPGSTGVCNISGAGAHWTTTATLTVGGGVVSGSQGTLSVASLGTVVSPTVDIGLVGGGTVLLNGGSLIVSNNVTIGHAQSGSFTNGVIVITNSGTNTGFYSAANLTTVAPNGIIRYNAGSFSTGSLVLTASASNASTMNVSAGKNKTVRTTSISIDTAFGSHLDLSDNRAIVNYTGTSPLGSIQSYIQLGYAGGAWTGPGINCSAAILDHTKGLGYGDNAILGYGSFYGHTIDATTVLIKFTWLGDANLDGKVDVTDLGALATNWQTSNSTWTKGDFNYNGLVDVTDLGALATNWQQGVGSPLARHSFEDALESVGLAGVVVPEPISAMLAIASLACLCIARRHRRVNPSPEGIRYETGPFV